MLIHIISYNNVTSDDAIPVDEMLWEGGLESWQDLLGKSLLPAVRRVGLALLTHKRTFVRSRLGIVTSGRRYLDADRDLT